MSRTLVEQETIIRWDAQDPVATLYTASPVVMRRWAKLGVELVPAHRDASGPTGWSGVVPKEAIRVRKVVGGKLVRRRRGGGFLGKANSEPQTAQ